MKSRNGHTVPFWRDTRGGQRKTSHKWKINKTQNKESTASLLQGSDQNAHLTPHTSHLSCKIISTHVYDSSFANIINLFMLLIVLFGLHWQFIRFFLMKEHLNTNIFYNNMRLGWDMRLTLFINYHMNTAKIILKICY